MQYKVELYCTELITATNQFCVKTHICMYYAEVLVFKLNRALPLWCQKYL